MSHDTLRQYVWNGCYVIQLVTDGCGSEEGGDGRSYREGIGKEAVSRYSPPFRPKRCSGAFVLLASILSDRRDMGIVRWHVSRMFLVGGSRG